MPRETLAQPDDAACFAKTMAVLRGERVPLDAGASKIMHFMLDSAEGCDAWMTPEKFVIQFGWHLSHHRYDSDIVPGVMSWLLTELGVREGVERTQGMLGAREIPKVAPFMAWRHGPRAVWIDAEPEKITILVRGTLASFDDLRARPAPIEPEIEYVVLARPCPSCGAVPERYRKLRDRRSIVCLACGASSPMLR